MDAGAAAARALISAATLIVIALTRGQTRAVRVVRAVGRRLPRVGSDRMEAIVHELTEALRHLIGARQLLRNAVANWLLDAAAPSCFVAALGRYAEPFELFAAYGIANVLAAIPVTPGGLGIVDATTPDARSARLAAGQLLVADPDRRHRLPDAAAAGPSRRP